MHRNICQEREEREKAKANNLPQDKRFMGSMLFVVNIVG